MNPGFDAFVGHHGAKGVPFEVDRGNGVSAELLWGDGVFFIADPSKDRAGFRYVQARGQRGWVASNVLDGEPLLELYFIDVGQGDGVLIRTPGFRHLLIDGGFPRRQQPTKKSAADFVDWKFHVDYARDRQGKRIHLDAMIASHNDHDHYGGLDDLLDVKQTADLDCEEVRIETFYHAGMSWWKSVEKDRFLGRVGQDDDGKKCFVDLLGDRHSASSAVADTAEPRLQGAWAALIAKVLDARNADGNATAIQRLSHATGVLPGFDGDVRIEVLGPIERNCDGVPGLRVLQGGDSKNTNGHSVVLRLEYDAVRLLVTGDLNQVSQRDLLETHGPRAFACDVSKACHHGSDDVSLAFLQAMEAGATVISSGDAEGHDHPRPRIVAASGITGHRETLGDELVTPLVYSTEIARSYRLGAVEKASTAEQSWQKGDLKALSVDYKEHKPGALRPKAGHCDLHGAFVLAGLVYGLVNVRTDGRRILCATLNEGKQTWAVREFQSRF